MDREQHEQVEEFELTSGLDALNSQTDKPSSQVDPFATPLASAANTAPNTAPGSRFPSSTALFRTAHAPSYFWSRRIQKGEQERPWLRRKDPKEKWVWIIPLVGLILGVAAGGAQIWLGLQKISNHGYCTVLNEDWSTGFNNEIWTKEAEVGGFG
jgi:hypothetical protein